MKISRINGQDRVITDYWDGMPVHRPLTAYERLCHGLKSQGAQEIEENDARLLTAFLGSRNGTDAILRLKKEVK